MNENAWHELMSEAGKFYYTNFLVMTCQLATIVVILIFFRKEKISGPFLLYCCSALCLFLISTFRHFLFQNAYTRYQVVESVNVVFSCIEYGVFYFYFRGILRSAIAKSTMSIIYLAMILFSILYFIAVFAFKISVGSIVRYEDYIISPTLFSLGIICMVYYFELFKQKSFENSGSVPSFWIVTGLFFYSLIISPFFMILSETFGTNHPDVYFFLFMLHYISLSFLFLCIAKAFLCKKPLTT